MSGRDPRGYYMLLGVEPDASAFDIRDAFRAKSYDLDPSRNPDPQAQSELRAIQAAYAVLSDRDSRLSYDSAAGAAVAAAAPAPTSGPSSGPPPGFNTFQPAAAGQPRRQLIACSRCGSTDLPRQLAFRWVVSAVVMSFRNLIQGVFCARCAGRAALGCNAGTAFLGWWGIPWGPIWSIAAIFGNAGGGTKNNQVTGAITWNNALAFLDAGDKPAAYRAAQRVTGEHTADAGHLVDQLRPEVGQLPQAPDPWRRNGLAGIGLVALGFAAPIALFLLLVFAVAAAPPLPPTVEDLRTEGFRFAGGPLNHEGREVTAFLDQYGGHTADVLFIDSGRVGHEPPFVVANVAFDCTRHTANQRTASHYLANGTVQRTDPATGPQAIAPNSAMAAAFALACGGASPNPTVFQGYTEARQYAFNHTSDVRNGPQCDHPVRSGAILEGHGPGRDFGHRLTIRNQTSNAAVVKVRDRRSGRLLFSFLVLAHEEADINGLRDGAYRIQYAQGDYLGRNCTGLIRTYWIGEITGVEPMTIRRTTTQEFAQHIGYTFLPQGQHGGTQADEVDVADFDN